MITTTPSRVLARVDLFHELDSMRRRMDEMFGSFPSRLPSRLFDGEMWTPTIEVFQDKDDLVVRADLPGVESKDVKVTLVDDVLTIEGERKEEHKIDEENLWFRESRYGDFLRRIAVPTGTSPEVIKASFKDGVLEVRVPMPVAMKPKEIPIRIG